MNRIKDFVRDIRDFYHNILRAPNSFGVPWHKSLKMKINGFTPNQYVLYNLKLNDSANYINELERWRTRRINGYYNIVLDDKILFNKTFKNYLDMPHVLLISHNGYLYTEDGNQLDLESFKLKLEEVKKMFVRPTVGGGGSGIYKVTFSDNKVYKNKELTTIDQVFNDIVDSNNIITEVINQHTYSNDINPKSINTIRILTYYDPKLNKVIVLDAVHRFGTAETYPVDNVSNGGLFSLIDLETGTLSIARDYQNKEYKSHPDTGSKIKGEIIPGWEDIITKCKKVAKDFFNIPYLAWDIVKVDDGFKVIEINASSGLTLFQMWEGKRNNKLGKYLNI